MNIAFDRFSLSKDGNPILSDISFEVSGPGVLAIIGQSGTGKSTLLEVLTRQIEPRHVLQNDCVRGWTCNGEVHVAGQHIQNWEPTELRRSIGLVLQHPVMLPGSIDRNLSGILRAANPELSRIAAQNRAALALVDAGLGNEIRDLKRSAQALSGGQKQRLAIARAIQLEPAIICMDEPTSALDAVAALAIVELIKSLAAKRLVIVVTHDLRIAHKADRVILIGTSSQSENVGTTILKDGPAETVLAQSNEENSALFRADLALRSA